MSDTPRTDALAQKYYSTPTVEELTDLAETLERELNEAKRDLAQAAEVVLHLAKHRDILKAQLDEAKAEIAAITADRDKEAERINKMESLTPRNVTLWTSDESGDVIILADRAPVKGADLREAIDKL